MGAVEQIASANSHLTFSVGMVDLCTHLFRKEFRDWLTSNWSIYLEFERRANALWAQGRKHYSARTIMEAIRFDTDMREKPNELDVKLNNNFIPDCARLYMLTHSGREGFFERRSGCSAVRTK
jgi:hypothetical protein